MCEQNASCFFAFNCILSSYHEKAINALHELAEESTSSLRIIIWRSTQNKVKKFKQNLPENHSKIAKIAIRSIFSKIFRGSMPPDSLRAFLVSQSASNLFYRKKKIRLKKCGNYGPSLPFKISCYATATNGIRTGGSGVEPPPPPLTIGKN